MRNAGVMRAQTDSELLKTEEFLKLLASLCEQAKQQIKMEIGRFKACKGLNTQSLIMEF
jgi:hypothetical protein